MIDSITTKIHMLSNEKKEKLQKFVEEHKFFWWWIPEEALPNLGLASIVEGSLNYGKTSDIKQLFDLVGIEKVAEIFYQAIRQKRVNYHPRTIHFFDLYFKRHLL